MPGKGHRTTGGFYEVIGARGTDEQRGQGSSRDSQVKQARPPPVFPPKSMLYSGLGSRAELDGRAE